MAVRSRTHYKRLKKAFSESGKVDVIVARMSVLYEDLRIEAYGATSANIDRLDANGASYRQLYFVRRSAVTLHEFVSAFNMLDQCPDFNSSIESFRPEYKQAWTTAREFFEANKQLIAAIRHESGGHFKHGTAANVLKQLHPDTYERLDLVLDHANQQGGPRLRYALEFVAIAMQVEKADREPSNHYYARIFEVIWTAWQHAVMVMHAIVAHHVVSRFE